MSENPRDLIRAAQSAELQGDVKRAVDCLKQAAELYQKAGNAPRALQLLRHARKLDGSRVDIAEEVNRLEWNPETLIARPSPGDDEDSRLVSELDRSLAEEPLPELVRRQRLLEDALREASAHAGDDGDAPRDSKAWVIDTEVAEDMQRLEAQLARVAASVDAEAVARAGGVTGSPVESVRATASVDVAEGRSAAATSADAFERRGAAAAFADASERRGAAASVDVAEGYGARVPGTGTARTLTAQGSLSAAEPSGELTARGRVSDAEASSELVAGSAPSAPAFPRDKDDWRPVREGAASLAEPASPGLRAAPLHDEASREPRSTPDVEGSGLDAPIRRRREKRLIERGPTRADAALDAWCSFCCRPRSEVGDLVAGPTGSFICAGCLSESVALLGDVASAQAPVRQRPVEPPGAFMELVGQAEAQALLERALQTGARCLLAVGPEGCGKSVWFQQLQRQGRGMLSSLSALEQSTAPQPLLIEDVDRMPPEAHASLAAFLSRHPRHTVVLSTRGLCPDARGPVLRNDSGALPVPTTAALSTAVRGTVPVGLLEHVHVLLPLHAPTHAELVEIARKRLALREPAVSLSDDVLGAFAEEAVRSPRAGHELQALLNRVPAGRWSLENTAKPPAPRKGRRKGGA
ncbi:hypothetical protein JY651_11360 [Pyxidicoccus parkwayensis]|uniref:ClpX-type ZB domain-containing protein n=1 Tax=Pyxidicoccus parkwayensis TaxID=2813578 RepID=A0ABX7P4T5_9BACT|nr:ClpX C4-type zinc finger protein [Pyxidicoccus parkwaysis]QSQ25484.1 hypothetical protein JY651_11360 [Pyxidicoccus parkwaysis]